MGLHLCYELSLPADRAEADVVARLTTLRAHAATLPFEEVSEVVRLDARAIAEVRPLRGLSFESLEHVVQYTARMNRDTLYRESIGLDEDHEYELDEQTKRWRPIAAPSHLPAVVAGFAIAPAPRCEPATFALTRLHSPTGATRWWDHCCCKTQYVSLLGEEALVRCHGSLVMLLDVARMVGLDVEVRDQTGYWESRDAKVLIDAVTKMNRIVARMAGAFNDAVRDATGDSQQVGGAIFDHPDFERLETEPRRSTDN